MIKRLSDFCRNVAVKKGLIYGILMVCELCDKFLGCQHIGVISSKQIILTEQKNFQRVKRTLKILERKVHTKVNETSCSECVLLSSHIVLHVFQTNLQNYKRNQLEKD